MTKEKFKEIMKRNGMLACEVEDAICFVRDLLEFQADEVRENEPYATRGIERLERAAREVYDLLYYLEDVMEG
jgi:hypothetical protein